MNTVTVICIVILLTISDFVDAGKKKKDNRRDKDISRRSIPTGQLDPVDGGFSDWTLYSLCNTGTCTETWTRYCNNPRPRNGGATCAGSSFKKEHCREDSRCVTTTQASTEEDQAATDSKAHWSKWEPCSVSCGVGTRKRTMLPCDEGKECETQDQPCIKMPCESHHHQNGYGDWGAWGPCSNCVETRTRTCTQYDICGEKIDTETRQCECSLDTETMTECQKMRHTRSLFNGRVGYQVSCESDGKFKPVQCDGGSEKCWCVEENSGRQIFGTQHPSHMTGIYNCQAMSKMSRCEAQHTVSEMDLQTREYTPQCESDGSFSHTQTSDVDEIQWCVYTDGLEIPDTRLSINEAIACDPDLSNKTKCEATSGADCTSDGAEFHVTQCYQEGQWQICRCVYRDGQTKDATEMTTEVPECSIYADLSLTKCRAISLVSPSVQCLPSGEYTPERCNQDVCYCVDEQGALVPGSMIPSSGTRRTSCQDLIEMHKGKGGNGGGDHKTHMFTNGPRYTTQEETQSSPTLPPMTVDTTTGDWVTPTFPELFSSSSMVNVPDNIVSVEYSDWSEWTPCSVECNGGFMSSSRSCPVLGNACGGPDIATRWGECNPMPCIQAEVDLLEYEWSEDGRQVTITCSALGLPQPYVVIRNFTGYISEDDQIEYSQENGQVLVRYVISPVVETQLTCIATGEGQERRTIVISPTPAEVTSFTVSSSVVYLGATVTVQCAVSGLPRPGIRLLKGDTIIDEVVSAELVRVLKPTENSEYTCLAIQTDGEIGASSPTLELLVVDPCEGVQCQEHATCHVLGEGHTTCQCMQCESNNLGTVDMMCGNDCETYLNECELERASCLTGDNLYSLHQGSCSELEAPEITSSCPDRNVLEGSTVVLDCNAVGQWQKIVWSKDGVVVSRGRRLKIASVSVTDSGSYTCSVAGCGGTTEITCPLVIEKKDVEVCTQYGAGHFHQFSGAGFTYPGVCHYVLAMDCHYGSFYIYTGTSQCGSEEIPLSYASSVTLYVGWDALVLLRGFDVDEHGAMVHLHPGDELSYRNYRIWREHDMMYVTHPAANFTLAWDGLTVVSLTMSKSYTGRLCGLCGDVGVENNAVEDWQAHGERFEVDKYDRCNVADIHEETCTSEEQRREAEEECTAALYSDILSKCHDVVDVEEYVKTCVYDSCGVKWLEEYQTGMCNVISAYAVICEDEGVDLTGWRRQSPCPRELMHRVSYMSKKRRRRKRSLGFSEIDIMMGGD